MNHHCASDEILVALLKNDDQVAFDVLYNRYWRSLFAFIYKRILSREESEEIIHELMLGLWNNRKNIIIGNVKLYLFIAARNQINRYIKLQTRIRKYRELEINEEPIDTINTDILFNESFLDYEIEKVLSRMPSKTALIFRMHKIEEIPIRKIASEMMLTEKAVEYHITKSLKLVRHYLRNYNSEN